MDSPAHRENMVNPRFTHVGIAAVTDVDSGNVVVTLVFARRAPAVTSRPTATDLQQRAQAARRARGLEARRDRPGVAGRGRGRRRGPPGGGVA